MKIGDFVIIEAEHPVGVPNTTEKGCLGCIIDEDDDSYSVKTELYFAGNYWYHSDELRLATDDEIIEFTRNVFLKDRQYDMS